jgi:hypothetical protein
MQEEVINQVIKGAQKRGEQVMRAEKVPQEGFKPRNFDIFTHMAVGTQYEVADDIASRCIKIPSKPVEGDVFVPMWIADDVAQQVRNHLLYARFRLLHSDEWEKAERRAYQYLDDRGIRYRLAEKLLSLVTVAELWDARDEIAPFVDAMEQQHKRTAAESEDAIFVEAVRDLAIEKVQDSDDMSDPEGLNDVEIPLKEVAERFNNMTGRDISPSYMGQMRARNDLDKSRGRRGTRIDDSNLLNKLQKLCADNSLDWAPAIGKLDGDRPQAKEYLERKVREKYDSDDGAVSRPALLGLASKQNIDDSEAKEALETLCSEGRIIRASGGPESDSTTQYRPN